MKKYLIRLAMLALIGLLLFAEYASWGRFNACGSDAFAGLSMLIGALIGILLRVLVNMLGGGKPQMASFYLDDGQVIKIVGIIKLRGLYIGILAEMKPRQGCYLMIKKSDCPDDLKQNYYYRYLKGRIESLPIGQKG